MKARCRHFGECGGCALQDKSYKEQLDIKKKMLQEATGIKSPPVIESPRLWGFRNKMEFSFEGESLGLHPKGRYEEVVDLKECPVFSEDAGRDLQAVRNFAAEYDIPYYSRKNNSGQLRYLMIREGKFTGEKMVVLVVNGNSFKLEKEFARALRETVEGLKSVVVARKHSRGDDSFTSDYNRVYGPDHINMMIGNMNMKISPYTFFQPNSFTVEKMYSLIQENISVPAKVLDLYSGAASISLFIRGEGMQITAVENSPEAVEDAKRNYESVSPGGKYEFVTARVRQFLASQRRKWSYVILDPPRGGMSPKVWLHIRHLRALVGGPEKIFYISCSMKNLSRDIDFIRENTDWKITDVTGIDQFVHTPHLETVVKIDT